MSESAARREGAIEAAAEALGELRAMDLLSRPDVFEVCTAVALKLYPTNVRWRNKVRDEMYRQSLQRGEELW